MEIKQVFNWTHYSETDYAGDSPKTGKWMLFFNFDEQLEFFEDICKEVVSKQLIKRSKCSFFPNSHGQGVAIFYLDIDDMDTHKKLITYFLENNLIRRTKTGKLYNTSFKLNTQTSAGEYGDDFKAELKLADLINLSTGEFLY